MKKTIYSFIIVLVLLTSVAHSQTSIYVPDLNFRSYLVQNFPTCMSGNNILLNCPAVANKDSIFPNNLGINDLTGIEAFTNLYWLECNNNNLTWLPPLPNGLRGFDCSHNQLTSLPTLPPNLFKLDCSYNPNLSCLQSVGNIQELTFNNTSISCLPSYGIILNVPPINTLIPLCGLFNQNNCNAAWNIAGYCYNDQNNNCIKDSTEASFPQQKISLIKNGNLIQQTYSRVNGFYGFDIDSIGPFSVVYDTLKRIFDPICPTNGILLDSLTTSDSLKQDLNFGLQCATNPVDAAIITAYTNSFIPAHLNKINILAGDLVKLTVPFCNNTSVAARLTINYSGPINYTAPCPGALAPDSIIGNNLIYHIPDLSSFDIYNGCAFYVRVDTLAALGDRICFHAEIKISGNDFDSTNNTNTFCYTVLTSFDPNDKSVSPVNQLALNGDRWLYYTVRFQNTGTADAINIYITDTLDSKLDWNTLELLSYSHMPVTQLYNSGLVKFNFPNIYLPDSTSNEPGSHGYVQYKIRAKNNIAIGDIISNNANIYFDFNAPVVTNTVRDTVVLECSSLVSVLTRIADTLICQQAGANYQWINCTSGAIISGATQQKFTPSVPGIYAVIADYGTCKDTSACYTFSFTGIDEFAVSDIKAHPNPFRDELTISRNETATATLEIYNLLGERMLQKLLQDKTTTLSTQNWANGIYIVKVISERGVVTTKVVKGE